MISTIKTQIQEHPPLIFVGKRLSDVVLASLFLLLSFPLGLLFALLIKFDSEGPIFYSQVRVGLNKRHRKRRKDENSRFLSRPDHRQVFDRRLEDFYGKMFSILKFRTMHMDAEKIGPVWCQADDPRITRVGRFLRKTHLDELPQLINVLKGDMSLVGPRPERPQFVDRLTLRIPHYKKRLKVKPGITGLAQIRHREDLALSDVRKKIRYDMLYMKSLSPITDLKIILGTLPKMVGVIPRKGRFQTISRKPSFGWEPQHGPILLSLNDTFEVLGRTPASAFESQKTLFGVYSDFYDIDKVIAVLTQTPSSPFEKKSRAQETLTLLN